MHFVYKTDNLFQSIRVSDENSSVYKGISFFKIYLNSWLFVCSECTIQSHIIIFNPFWLHLLFFMHLLIILSYKTIKLKSISNELWKGWKLAWYHHFTHIACAKKLRGLRQNWMHFVYKTDNLFRSIRISYGNSSVTKGFHFFWNLFELLTFCVFKMQHSKSHHHFSILSDFICYFSCIY